MNEKPQRVQLRRTKGWRKPPGAVVVSRPTKWGNPFAIADFAGAINPRQMAVDCFRKWINEPAQREFREDVRRELRGKILCCWCGLGDICHGDVLLELANEERAG